MKKSGIVFLTSLLMLNIAGFSCSKEKAGLKEPPPVQVKNADLTADAPLPGEGLFNKHCKVCHGAGGKGDIGPGLGDSEWKYGGGDDDLYYSIAKGRPGGMPSWDHTLSEEKIREIMQYIRFIGEE